MVGQSLKKKNYSMIVDNIFFSIRDEKLKMLDLSFQLILIPMGKITR